jgi:hypothetical protein
MTTHHKLAFVLLALCAGASQACYVPPAAQRIGVAQQVRDAADVAVGQVIGATPLGAGEIEYRFLVLDQLAGPAQKTFTLRGHAPVPGAPDTSFDRHQDLAFWARGGGRTINDSDCVIHPGFVVGNSYLVFLGSPPTWRSFEKIDMVDGRPDPDDRWLAYVKAALSGTPAAPEDAPDYERIGRFLYGYQRLMTQQDLRPEVLAAEHAPSDLRWRAARLAAEHEDIVQHAASAPQAQLDAVLREAAALQAALAAWRSGAGH